MYVLKRKRQRGTAEAITGFSSAEGLSKRISTQSLQPLTQTTSQAVTTTSLPALRAQHVRAKICFLLAPITTR